MAISIHAPRTGSDARQRLHCPRRADFNPRSPHGERPDRNIANSVSCPFQSTLPARGATKSVHVCVFHHQFQSTLPARGATQKRPRVRFSPSISIHAPRTGSDITFFRVRPAQTYFNPRSPHGERPLGIFFHDSSEYFNPRSPHGERRSPNRHRRSSTLISIHAPRTGSDALLVAEADAGRFQSTLPARGATAQIET